MIPLTCNPSNLDFIRFNSNGACVTGADHYYYLNEKGEPKTPQLIDPITSTFNYSAFGAQYVLSQQGNVITPGGFVVRDTISLNGNHSLLFRSVFYSNISEFKSTTDAYYSR